MILILRKLTLLMNKKSVLSVIRLLLLNCDIKVWRVSTVNSGITAVAWDRRAGSHRAFFFHLFIIFFLFYRHVYLYIKNNCQIADQRGRNWLSEGDGSGRERERERGERSISDLWSSGTKQTSEAINTIRRPPSSHSFRFLSSFSTLPFSSFSA